MKHPDADRQVVVRVMDWLGASLGPVQHEQLEILASWLSGEAAAGGGIGPDEHGRIWARHLADSLTFAAGWVDVPPPGRLLDVGAGVGLPGIPLAILWPETLVTLLDRSGRRADLAQRAVRRLGLNNVDIRQGDVLSEAGVWQGVVFRAVFPPERACQVADGVLDGAGTAVIGLRGAANRRAATLVTVDQRSTRIVDVPATVLDGAVSLLIMGPR